MSQPIITFHSLDALLRALKAEVNLSLPDPNTYEKDYWATLVSADSSASALLVPGSPEKSWSYRKVTFRKHKMWALDEWIWVWERIP